MHESNPESKSLIFVLGEITSGGAERVASHLMQYWVKQGWKITLIAANEAKDDFYQIPEEVERIVISTGGVSANKVIGLMKNLPYIWNLRKVIKNSDAPNVLSFLTRPNIHTILACVGLNKNVVISERNDTTREDHLWPWNKLRRELYNYADRVTANSEIALKGMKGYVDEEKLFLVSNPVNIPDKFATPSESSRILNVGRLVPQKAQHLLIEAMSVINGEIRNEWTLEIFGDGEEEENLKSFVEETELEDVIHFRGVVNDLSEPYRSAGMFVLPSIYEGTPNALLEAMSYGLPCIISDAQTGVLDLIEDGKNGLIFRSEDSKGLSEKIKFLMDNPDLRDEMGRKARKSIEPFSIQNTHKSWDKLFAS